MAEKMMILMSTFQSAQAIRKMVDWSDIGIEVVAVEYNGAIGLEQFDYFKPRIVILDSMVPVIGTDKFIEEMMNSSVDFHIILLDDLEEKLSNILHIYRVIKKSTVTAEELRAVALEIIDALNKDSSTESSLESAGRFSRLSEVLGGGEFSIAAIQLLRDEIGLRLHQNLSVLLPYPGKNVDGIFSDNLLQKILNVLSEYSGGEAFVMDDGTLCVLVNDIQRPAKKENAYENMLFDIRKVLTAEYHFHWTFVLGDIVALRDLSHEYKECRRIYQYGYFCKELNLLRKGYLQKHSLIDEQEPAKTVDRIMHVLMQPTSGDVHHEIESLFSNQKKIMNIERVNFWKRTLELIYLSMLQLYAVNPRELDGAGFFDTANCTIEDDVEGVDGLFSSLQKEIAARERAVNPLTIHALTYIITRYSEDITLQVIAESINAAPTYLSHLFKKEVGVTFINYFTMVRLTSAKRMLIQTDKKIVDIATEVGFSDYRYFSRVFRKLVGKTPSEFKAALRRG